jgi:hypothetical protein
MSKERFALGAARALRIKAIDPQTECSSNEMLLK